MVKPPRHAWDHDGERRLSGIDAADGCARNERTCRRCGIVRVTVLPPHGFPWHEWRTETGVYVGEMTPPCSAQNDVTAAREATSA